MKIKFWGVRGSIPTPGPATCRYGGNTACIEVTGDNGEHIILDAGTGIRELGMYLMKRDDPPAPIHLFISHTHWDHIQGFPFFIPCFFPKNSIRVIGPVHYLETKGLKDIFDTQMQYDFFPISNQQLLAHLEYVTLSETAFNIGTLEVSTRFSNHPIRSLMYKITEGDRSMVYTGDHEPYYNVLEDGHTVSDDDLLFVNIDDTVAEANERFTAFISGVDLLVADCQYTPEEYPSQKRGWGHSSWDFCLDWMRQSGTKKMVLTHHDPLRSDDGLDHMVRDIRAQGQEAGIAPDNILMAAEGMEIEL